MKTIIQNSPLILIGILTTIVIGLLFLVLPIILLWMKVDTFIGSNAIADGINESETVRNSAINASFLQD